MLRNLHEMMKSGVLSESEFRTKKWELLLHEAQVAEPFSAGAG